MYSDKAKQFVAADKNLRALSSEIDFSKLENNHYGADGPMEWKFSTPNAPWQNGVTERMVGMLK
jgi:hypothetical protein